MYFIVGSIVNACDKYKVNVISTCHTARYKFYLTAGKIKPSVVSQAETIFCIGCYS